MAHSSDNIYAHPRANDLSLLKENLMQQAAHKYNPHGNLSVSQMALLALSEQSNTTFNSSKATMRSSYSLTTMMLGVRLRLMLRLCSLLGRLNYQFLATTRTLLNAYRLETLKASHEQSGTQKSIDQMESLMEDSPKSSPYT